MAEAQGPMEIELTIRCGIDKDGRMTFDWDGSATVPKDVTPPRIDAYLAKQIMEGAQAAMEIKNNLNWSVQPKEKPDPGEPPDDAADALP